MKTNKAQHTPGNWETLPRYTDRQAVPVGKMRTDGSKAWDIFAEAHGPNCEANARLIAAAPELLEACVSMLPLHESYQADMESPSFKGSKSFVTENKRRLDAIRAAISKAQGKD